MQFTVGFHLPTGCYRHTRQLLALDAHRPSKARASPAQLSPTSSPLAESLPAWEERLAMHPDRGFADYVLRGIREGFRVGFNRSQPLSPAKRNMPSALQHPEVVEAYLGEERDAGRILGPFQPGEISDLHINRLGVVPKGRASGKWRLITDLSFPEGASVNEGIDPDLCSLSYTSVEKVAGAARKLGVGALLAKADIKAAYRLVPVHPRDRPLLGLAWKGCFYVDAMLPFGLRSAPKIFTAVADAVEWCVRRRGVVGIDHYLDDFVIVAPPRSGVCQRYLALLEEECRSLGVTLAPEKQVGPSTCLTFLGIQIDTVSGRLSLPAEKLSRLRQEIDSWMRRRACRKRELESLLGVLQHAATVIPPGRTFVRRIIDLLRGPRRPHHFIRLNHQFRADFHWWGLFAESWNGVAFSPPSAGAPVEFASDASGSWGCGAWCGKQWWQWSWPPRDSEGIAFKELFAVVVSAVVWGKHWSGQHVLGHCDNEAVTIMLASRTSKHPGLMHLLRCLFFIEAQYGFRLSVSHIAGVANDLADDLSRNRLFSFLLKAPEAEQLPTPVPPAMLELLLDTGGTWTSPNWTRRFVSCVRWD